MNIYDVCWREDYNSFMIFILTQRDYMWLYNAQLHFLYMTLLIKIYYVRNIVLKYFVHEFWQNAKNIAQGYESIVYIFITKIQSQIIYVVRNKTKLIYSWLN